MFVTVLHSSMTSSVEKGKHALFLQDTSRTNDLNNNWVAVRRTYVFTLQEVEKICRTLQSRVMLVWEGSRTLPFLSHKLPFFS